MDFLKAIVNDFKGFWNLSGLIDIVSSGNYSKFLTYDGMLSLLGPVVPFLLLFEIIRAAFYKRFKVINYKVSFWTYVLNAFVGRVISFGLVGLCIKWLLPVAFFKTSFTWYWFIYSYIIWEFAHFWYHFLAHKVRLLWCLHSTHHAPEDMNLAVSYAHFFLEAPYADFIRTSICILLGVSPAVLFVIMFIDGFWGTLIHVGENIVRDGRLGFLNKIILTPSHHRVHHARNVVYMDTNFCNLLNVWDRAFGTYHEEDVKIPIEYGISRPMIKNSFLDAYFGEIIALAKDVYRAPGIKNKFMYIFMPPGWSHTGDHKMTHVVRKKYFEDLKKHKVEPDKTAPQNSPMVST
ncbi:MAG: fatty acid hydroxylase [Thalassobium sp.]|nr:MAG: fatty acid hydroxylase [Thalassobium sp.]